MNKKQTIELFTLVNKLITSRNELTGVGHDIYKFALSSDLMKDPPVLATLIAIRVAIKPLDEIIEIHTCYMKELMERQESSTKH